MTDHHESDLPDLDPDVAAMLRREAGWVQMPSAAATRVMDRMAASIGGPGPGGGGEGPGGSAGGAGAGGAGAASVAAASGIVAKVAPLLVAVALAAGGVGVAVLRPAQPAPPPTSAARVDPAPSAPRTEVPEVPIVSAAPSASLETVSVHALPSALVVAPTTSVAARPAPSTVTTEDGLVAERTLLDSARGSLARGDHDAAMHSLDEHARTYASGQLAEEREALRVRTLASSGRRDEARAAADRFRVRWPASVMLPAVESAVRPTP